MRPPRLLVLVLLTTSVPALAQQSEPQIAEYCRTRANGKRDKDRNAAEAACRTLLKGAIDSFTARQIPEAMEQLRLLEQAVAAPVAKKKAAKSEDGGLSAPVF